jgi:hypothetical protein
MIPYSVSFNAVAVTAAQDLLSLASASTTVCEILGIVLSQNTEVGDAQDEDLNIRLVKGVGATVGSGGSSQTPAKLETGAAAAAFTARKNDTTIMVAGGGSLLTLHTDSWNVRTQWVFEPTPERRIFLSPSERFTVELVSAPADSVTMNGTIYVGQYGG